MGKKELMRLSKLILYVWATLGALEWLVYGNNVWDSRTWNRNKSSAFENRCPHGGQMDHQNPWNSVPRFSGPMPFCVCHDDDARPVYGFPVFQSSFSHQFRIFFRIKKCLSIFVHQPGISDLISVKKQCVIKGINENLSVLMPFPQVGKLLVFLFACSGSNSSYWNFSTRSWHGYRRPPGLGIILQGFGTSYTLSYLFRSAQGENG